MITQIGRLARTTLIYGVGQVLLRFISLLLMPLFTSFLTPTEYGISAMLGLISMVVTPIFSLGLGTAIGVCFFEHTDRLGRSTVIWTSFLMLVVSVSAVFSSMLLFATSISELVFQTPEYAYFVQLNAATIAIGILLNPFLYFLQFEERAISYVVITVIVGVVSILLSIFFVVYRRQGLEGVLIATVVGQILGFFLYFGWSLSFLEWGCRLQWPDACSEWVFH
ncbi:MAG: oligosaccharide flippase family protein [Thermomicrobiales bacterium]